MTNRKNASHKVIELDSTPEGGNLSSSQEDVDLAGGLPAPHYLLELAKSGRAECKRCGEKLEKAGELIQIKILFIILT
jgi:hypothetical protein